jgi:hypothetical protein
MAADGQVTESASSRRGSLARPSTPPTCGPRTTCNDDPLVAMAAAERVRWPDAPIPSGVRGTSTRGHDRRRVVKSVSLLTPAHGAGSLDRPSRCGRRLRRAALPMRGYRLPIHGRATARGPLLNPRGFQVTTDTEGRGSAFRATVSARAAHRVAIAPVVTAPVWRPRPSSALPRHRSGVATPSPARHRRTRQQSLTHAAPVVAR